MQYEAESRKAESSLTGLGATGHRPHLGSYRGGLLGSTGADWHLGRLPSSKWYHVDISPLSTVLSISLKDTLSSATLSSANIDSMDMSLSKLQEVVKHREA